MIKLVVGCCQWAIFWVGGFKIARGGWVGYPPPLFEAVVLGYVLPAPDHGLAVDLGWLGIERSVFCAGYSISALRPGLLWVIHSAKRDV